MATDDSRATTPKHRSIPLELQRMLDLHHRKHPSNFIFCHTYLHRHQHSDLVDFGFLHFSGAFGWHLLVLSVAKEPGITKA